LAQDHSTYKSVWQQAYLGMRHLLFDTETTGLIKTKYVRQERWPRIIEIYAVLVDDNNNTLEVLDQVVDPAMRITQEITDITGITNAMVKGKPYISEVLPKFESLVEAADRVVAHNLSYDTTVVDLECIRLNMIPIIWPERFCTVENTIHMKQRRLNLTALHEHLFGEGFESAHRAKNDVDATRRCYFELMKRGSA
jgi:DNA polymerase III epsilon subunit-like protein